MSVGGRTSVFGTQKTPTSATPATPATLAPQQGGVKQDPRFYGQNYSPWSPYGGMNMGMGMGMQQYMNPFRMTPYMSPWGGPGYQSGFGYSSPYYSMNFSPMVMPQQSTPGANLAEALKRTRWF